MGRCRKIAEALDPRQTWYLRVAVAACFFCHGLIAIQSSTVYYSEWNAWVQSLFPFTNGFVAAKHLLRTVGTLDVLVAMAFLRAKPLRVAFLWAVGWGFLTAFSRAYFLGAMSPPVLENLVRPGAEVLIRTSNWVLPLLVFIRVHSRPLFPRFLREQNLIDVVVFASIFGRLLLYAIQFANPLYPYEITRSGESLIFFHFIGGLLILAMLLLVSRRVVKERLGKLFSLAIGLLGGVALCLTLVFETFWVNLPHGLAFAALRFGEHLPELLCFGIFFVNAIQGWRRQALPSVRALRPTRR